MGEPSLLITEEEDYGDTEPTQRPAQNKTKTTIISGKNSEAVSFSVNFIYCFLFTLLP